MTKVLEPPIYVCNIERREYRGREQFRYLVRMRCSPTTSEMLKSGRWTTREKAERKGLKVREKQEKRFWERQVTTVETLP